MPTTSSSRVSCPTSPLLLLQLMVYVPLSSTFTLRKAMELLSTLILLVTSPPPLLVRVCFVFLARGGSEVTVKVRVGLVPTQASK